MSKQCIKKPDITEREFMRQVRQLAKLFGWTVYHPAVAQFSEKGFPDLTLIKERADGSTALIFAELKTERGKLTDAQTFWINQLEKVGGNVQAFVWRPSDLEMISGVLRGANEV